MGRRVVTGNRLIESLADHLFIVNHHRTDRNFSERLRFLSEFERLRHEMQIKLALCHFI